MDSIRGLKRVVVVGTSCAGKTTFAAELARRLQVPHVELDQQYWLPDWQARPKDEFRRLVRKATEAERWVVDGNYSKVRDIVWPRATSIVWLDYSFPVVFGRALRRSLRRIINRKELFSGNQETFRKTFLARESILLWVLKTYRRRRREYPELFAKPSYTHLVVHRLLKPTSASRFLGQVTAQTAQQGGGGSSKHGA
jgi:adenylate kinase family enzyme